jgi:hypothetical protein
MTEEEKRIINRLFDNYPQLGGQVDLIYHAGIVYLVFNDEVEAEEYMEAHNLQATHHLVCFNGYMNALTTITKE